MDKHTPRQAADTASDQIGPGYRGRWEETNPTPGRTWEDMEPAYRYAHELSNDPEYQGRLWEDIQPQLKSGDGNWAEAAGHEDTGPDAWEGFKDRLREAWNDIFHRGRS